MRLRQCWLCFIVKCIPRVPKKSISTVFHLPPSSMSINYIDFRRLWDYFKTGIYLSEHLDSLLIKLFILVLKLRISYSEITLLISVCISFWFYLINCLLDFLLKLNSGSISTLVGNINRHWEGLGCNFCGFHWSDALKEQVDCSINSTNKPFIKDAMQKYLDNWAISSKKLLRIVEAVSD